jgi:hypothetical protein
MKAEMSTSAQILANRQNAAHSTGPKSPEGKEVSSRNATRHGLAGVFTVLPHENPEDFTALAARLRDEFQPDTENEEFLVDQMIQSRCRLLRIQRLEALAFEQILTEPGGNADPDARILAAICASGNALDKLRRYASAAERAYYKALREFQNCRAKSQKSESKAVENAVENILKQALFAPIPGFEPGCARSAKAAVQNEPNFQSPPRPAHAGKAA